MAEIIKQLIFLEYVIMTDLLVLSLTHLFIHTTHRYVIFTESKITNLQVQR